MSGMQQVRVHYRPGTVYVLQNPSLPDGIYKIGFTQIGAQARAQALSGTGLPTPFQVVFEVGCVDCKACERFVFHLLEDWRLSHTREFFLIHDLEGTQRSLRYAVECVEAAYVGRYPLICPEPLLRDA